MEKKNGIAGLKEIGQKLGGTAIDVLHKAQDVGQKTSVSVQKGALDLSDKMKQAGYANRMKKYNPLFPDVYHSESFNLPNMITIVDDAVRRGIDVCVGAIGWLGKSAGTEVLYLYDEAVQDSGLTFIPTPQCDAIYYVDPFDRKRFIRVDRIFSLAQEERIAELKHIAHALGAKRFAIDSSESANVASKVDASAHATENLDRMNNADEHYEQHSANADAKSQTIKNVIELTGNDNPQMPNLKWYAHDDNILRLIDMRMAKEIRMEQFELSGASSSTMSHKTACAIDSAVKGIEAKANISMETQVMKEQSRKLYYSIEF